MSRLYKLEKKVSRIVFEIQTWNNIVLLAKKGNVVVFCLFALYMYDKNRLEMWKKLLAKSRE